MLEVGQAIGAYRVTRIIENIHEKNESAFYSAEVINEANEIQTVAIKIIKNYNRKDTNKNIDFWQKLPEHPNILKLFEVHYTDSDIWLVTDFLPRGNLKNHIGDFSTAEDFSKLLTGILDGVTHLHSQKPPIIHRDIKPEHILLREDGTPLLTDFCISRAYEPDVLTSVRYEGTFSYASPEALNRELDPRNDLWAVGVIAYELLSAGKHPFSNFSDYSGVRSPEEIANFIRKKNVPELPLKHKVFESFIQKALDKNVNSRFKTAADMKQSLLNIMINESNNQNSEIETTDNDEIDLKIKECVSAIQLLVNKADQKFRIKMLKEILIVLNKELNALNAITYNFDIGTEKNFLVRATPLFENADKVYAVSLDSVSSFWTTKERNLKNFYIRKQPVNTIRLFVFENAKRAHNYSYILEANNKRYGSSAISPKGEGMVLVCSYESYQKFLRNYTDLRVEDYQNKDFGLLRYDNKFIEATLDASELVFKEQDHVREYAFELMVEKLDSLSTLKDGEIDKETNFLRWSSSFLDNRELWAERLKTIFKMKAGREYYHLVFFAPNVNQKIVIETKRLLYEKRAELGLEDVWVGDRYDLNVTDGKFGGTINTGEKKEWNRILIMRFRNRDEMEAFYHHPLHSDIRRYAFSNFAPYLETMYKKLLEEKENSKRRELYQEIESQAGQFMERRDYIDAEEINDIVKHDPEDF